MTDTPTSVLFFFFWFLLLLKNIHAHSAEKVSA